jgi:phenylpyruvate tautomerase
MASITLTTNVKIDGPSTSFIPSLSKFAAETLGIAQRNVFVMYTHNDTLCFDGSFEPAFHLVIRRPGITTAPERIQGYSASLTDFLEKTLSTPKNRGYINFLDQTNSKAVGRYNPLVATESPCWKDANRVGADRCQQNPMSVLVGR